MEKYLLITLYEQQLKDEIKNNYPLPLVTETYQNLKKAYIVVRDLNNPVMEALKENMKLYDDYKRIKKND